MEISDLIIALCDRGDAELTRWAIEWLDVDLTEIWDDLEDEHRDHLVSSGAVRTIEAEVECTDADSWVSDWRPENRAAWPCYTLEVTAVGMPPLELTGWHLVGPMGPDANRRHQEWDQEDSDGGGNGRCRVDGWQARSGDYVGEDHVIPVWWRDGRWYTLDRDALQDAIDAAASSANHGAEPTWEDVDRDELEYWEGRYIIQDGRVIEVATLSGGIAPYEQQYEEEIGEDEDGYMRYRTASRTLYYATAWSHSLTEETWETEGEALGDLRALADDGKAYRSESEAIAALCELATDEHETPDGMTTGIDDEGWYVCPEDDEGERYHLDADEAAILYHVGWDGIVETLRDAFGARACLAALREQQVNLDRIIEERDPYVSVSDSLAAGNCRQVTEQVRQQITERVGATGEIGGVRASVLLALRDDMYSRRACRMAALRMLSQH